VLFAHVCALLVAISAGALSHFSESRLRSAETKAAEAAAGLAVAVGAAGRHA
jgi:hypothetical protein